MASTLAAGSAGSLKPLELIHRFQNTLLSIPLRARSHMLPLKKEAKEGSRRHWLDLPAQMSKGRAMNSCQDAPVAKFFRRLT